MPRIAGVPDAFASCDSPAPAIGVSPMRGRIEQRAPRIVRESATLKSHLCSARASEQTLIRAATNGDDLSRDRQVLERLLNAAEQCEREEGPLCDESSLLFCALRIAHSAGS
jgi:hypothetical protein